MNDRKLPTPADMERMDISALETVASGRYPISVDKSEMAQCALRVIKRMRAEIERLTGACESYRIDRDRLVISEARLRAALETGEAVSGAFIESGERGRKRK